MADTTPTWKPFVSHVDSTGQASTMEVVFSPDNAVVSLLFDRMTVSLQDNDASRLAGAAVLAGSFAIALPDEFSLRGFVLTARGKVLKTGDTSAVLTLAVGQSGRVFEWPATSATPGETQDFDLVAECFSSDDHSAVGQPPTFPPIAPLTISIGIHARRRSTQGAVLATLDSVDISMLDFVRAGSSTDQPAKGSYQRSRET
jgi:hypothetical protein